MSSAKHKPKPTPESRVFKAAYEASEITQAALAERWGVTPGLISQWATGRTPISAVKAPMVARDLQIEDPAAISTAYRDNEIAKGNALPMKKLSASEETREISLIIARLENDVHALNLALGLLVGAMKHHRSAEAKELASTIRRKVPAKYRDKGLLNELLAALEKPARDQ